MSFDKAAARAAFKASRETLNCIPFPPYGAVYWKPATMREVIRINQKAAEGPEAHALENFLVRALKEDGTRLFNDAERMELLKEWPPEVIGLISGQMPLVTSKADIQKHP